MSYKETSAIFVENQCMFGAYPTQSQIKELEDWGIDIFVNLTNDCEKKIHAYTTVKQVICFPIQDRSVPDRIEEFCALVVKLSNEIDSGKKIYIHCKAGHGRSGTLVASLFCYRNNLTPEDSFRKTTECHATRPVHARRPRMNEYWKSKGSPQTEHQRNFVRVLFQPYKICSEFLPVNLHTASRHGADSILNLNEVKKYVLQTYLGPIYGENSEILMNSRKKLFEELFESDTERVGGSEAKML